MLLTDLQISGICHTKSKSPNKTKKPNSKKTIKKLRKHYWTWKMNFKK